jgi:hypothetical protein
MIESDRHLLAGVQVGLEDASAEMEASLAPVVENE